MPAARTHQARPTANAHDVSTSNGALPNPSANGRAQPAAIRARMPTFSARTCKSAGRNIASKPIAVRTAALAVIDMSRAYVNTPSKNGNTDTFMNDETESTSDNAANERQNAGVNRSRAANRSGACAAAARPGDPAGARNGLPSGRSVSVCSLFSVMPAFYHAETTKAPHTRRCTALHISTHANAHRAREGSRRSGRPSRRGDLNACRTMRGPQTGETPSLRKQEANGSRGAAPLGLGQALPDLTPGRSPPACRRDGLRPSCGRRPGP